MDDDNAPSSSSSSSSASMLKRSISRAFVSSGHVAPLPPDVLSGLAVLSSSLCLSPTRLAEAWEAHSLTRGLVDCQLDASTFAGYRKTMLASGRAGGGGGGGGEQKQLQQKQRIKVERGGGVGGGNNNNNNATVVMSTTGLGKRSTPTAGGVTPSPAAKRGGANGNGNGGGGIGGKDGLSAVDGLAPSPDSPDKGGGGGGGGRGSGASAAAAAITPPPKGGDGEATPTPGAVVVGGRCRYADRTNAGEVVAAYDPASAKKEEGGGGAIGEGGRRPPRAAAAAAVTVLRPPGFSADDGRSSGGRHMFAPLEARAAELERRLEDADAAMRASYGIKDEDEEILAALDGGGSGGVVVVVKEEEGTADGSGKGGGRGYATWTPVGLPKQNEVLCVGRICNEAHEGRLNRASVRLEGSRRHSMGSRIKLDLSGLLENDNNNNDENAGGYSLFPGQIVAVEGINPSGGTMRVSRVIEGAGAPPPPPAPDDRDRRAPLSIWAACGPYTTSDDLDYDPLLDLVESVASERPDVVVLCGPFVDGRQALVAGEGGAGPVIADNDDDYDARPGLVTPERLFASKVSSLLADMYELDPGSTTQFVLVPSLDDAFADAVYPQAAFRDGDRGPDARFASLGLGVVEDAGRRSAGGPGMDRARRVHLATNPCTLSVDGVVVGVTSTDVLFHLASDGCDAGLPPGSRLARLAGHLVGQGSYYPLFPSGPGVPLDMTKAGGWEMPVRPDVLVVPSRLAPFARPAAGAGGGGATLAVNPGVLTKGSAGGTYARIEVRPRGTAGGATSGDDGPGSAADGGSMMPARGVMDRVRVEVRRI